MDRGVDTEDVEHIYNGILLRHKKEQNNSSCSNMDTASNYLSESHLLHSVWQTSYDFT